jgi:hypothetical protein
MKRNLCRIFVLASLVLTISVKAEDSTGTTIDNPSVVNDEDKTSGRVNDLISSVETALKAADIIATAQTVKKTWDKVSKFKNLKDWKDFGSKQLTGLVTQYKSTKWSLFSWLDNVSSKMADIMAKGNDRVNMWRTTEPMLISYYNAMGKLSNNTVQVFRDFELSDLIDIDRKWSRKMEGQVMKDEQLIYSFLSFASSHFDDNYYNRKFTYMFMSDAMKKELTKTQTDMEAYLEIMNNVHPFNQIPYQTMNFSSDAMLKIREVSAQAHAGSTDDPTTSNEQEAIDKAEYSLNNQSSTYNDIMDNKAFLEAQRAKVAIQRIQLQQIFEELQTRYTRLLLRNRERMAIQYEAIDNTINRLGNGGTFENLDTARVRRFGEDAGLEL